MSSHSNTINKGRGKAFPGIGRFRRERSGSTIIMRDTRDAFVLILPVIILLLVFIVYPVLSNFYYAFTDWDGLTEPRWIAFDNFIRNFNDIRFQTSLKNTFIMICYIPFAIALPLFLAALLRDGLKGWTVFRFLLYLPSIIGGPLIAIMYKIFFRKSGVFNALLESVGLDKLALNWLGDGSLAIHSVAVLSLVLGGLGFGVIYFLSAMSNIDNALYEAAEIDGAGWWTALFRITIPGIRFAIEFMLVLNFITVFARMFGTIYNLTLGGPGFSTYTLEFGIYMLGFRLFEYGRASSWAVLLFLFCSIIALFQILQMKRAEDA